MSKNKLVYSDDKTHVEVTGEDVLFRVTDDDTSQQYEFTIPLSNLHGLQQHFCYNSSPVVSAGRNAWPSYAIASDGPQPPADDVPRTSSRAVHRTPEGRIASISTVTIPLPEITPQDAHAPVEFIQPNERAWAITSDSGSTWRVMHNSEPRLNRGGFYTNHSHIVEREPSPEPIASPEVNPRHRDAGPADPGPQPGD